MTSTLTAPASTPTVLVVRRTPVAVTAIISSVVAAAVTTGYGAMAIAIHGSMHAGDLGASHAARINAGSFGIGTLMSAILGVVIAIAVARFATQPVRRWTQVTVGLLVVSLLFPLTASHTDNATRFVLAGAHLLAGAIVIPAVRLRLSRAGR